MRRENKLEKRWYKQSGPIKTWTTIDYDGEYSDVKESVYNYFSDKVKPGEDKPMGQLIADRIVESLDDMTFCYVAISDEERVDHERSALRHYTENWIAEYKNEYGEDALNKKISDVFKYVAQLIADRSDKFTGRNTRLQPYIYLECFALPRLFVLADVDNKYRDHWKKLRSMAVSMIRNGSDIYYKRHYQTLIESVSE